MVKPSLMIRIPVYNDAMEEHMRHLKRELMRLESLGCRATMPESMRKEQVRATTVLFREAITKKLSLQREHSPAHSQSASSSAPSRTLPPPSHPYYQQVAVSQE